MLYTTFLDLWYADKLYDDYIHDLMIEVKSAKAHKKKTAKLLAQAKEEYKKVHNVDPMEPKK